jgi:hypothetical protein
MRAEATLDHVAETMNRTFADTCGQNNNQEYLSHHLAPTV